jgi:ankyrin repeat protein
MIKFLCNENINPDAPNINNITPVHIACSKQFYSIVKFFISIKVNINYQDNYGNTALHIFLDEDINLINYPEVSRVNCS